MDLGAAREKVRVARWLDEPIAASAPGWDGQPVDDDLCISALR